MSSLRIPVLDLNCLYCNIRSIQKNTVPLKFTIKCLNCDVVVITESWLDDTIHLAPILGDLRQDFCYARCDRLHKRGGGVVILLRNSIMFEKIWCESAPDAFEILCCDLIFMQYSLRLIVYRAPSSSLSSTILLAKVLNDLCSCKTHCVILGDFNLPVTDSSKGYPGSMASQCFINMCKSCKLNENVLTPTRNVNVPDLVLSSHPNLVKNLVVLSPIGSSDHSSISLISKVL